MTIRLSHLEHLRGGRFRGQAFRELLEEIKWTAGDERPIVRTYSRRELRRNPGAARFRVSAIEVSPVPAIDVRRLP